MPKAGADLLTSRRSQIMSVLWELGSATAEEIREVLSDDLHDSTVRTLLRSLEEKGFVTHSLQGRKFVYSPAVEQVKVQGKALRGFLKRFFGGSAEALVQHLIRDEHITPEELARIRKKAPLERKPERKEETRERKGSSKRRRSQRHEHLGSWTSPR